MIFTTKLLTDDEKAQTNSKSFSVCLLEVNGNQENVLYTTQNKMVISGERDKKSLVFNQK